MNRRLQLHAALRQGGQFLRGVGRDAPDGQFFLAGHFALHALPPHFGRRAKGVEQHVVGFAAGFAQGFFLGLAHFNPQALGAGEVGDVDIRIVRVRQARAKGQRAVAVAQRLQLPGVQRQRHQPHHHAFVGFAGVARQGEVVVGVVAVVDVGNRQVGFEDGGFQGHKAWGYIKNKSC